jgi:ankyrin repeat protein
MKMINPVATSSENLTALHLAAREGRLSCIIELLRQGVDVNITTEGEMLTPLHLAAKVNKIKTVKTLLFFYADIGRKDSEDNTPYDLATKEIVKKHLFNPTPTQSDEKPFNEALALLPEKSLTEFKEIVFENRGIINFRDKDGFTLLHHACVSGSESHVKFLLSNGANAYARNAIDGRLPIHYAAMRHEDEIINLFPIELFEEFDRTRESAHQLYDRTKNLDDQKTKYYNIVNCILNKNPENEELAIKAIKKKNTPYIAREDGFTLIHYATMANYIKILQQLLARKDSNPNAATNDKTTALMLAAMAGTIDSAKLLIDKKANVNAVNANGSSALNFAVANNKKEMVEFLISKGADIKVENPENGSTILHNAAMAATPELFIHLFPEFNDINLMCKDGTPLHFAAKMGRVETIKYLAENGADFNLTDEKGNLPLHIAAAEGRIEALKVLVPHYSDITVKGSEGNNILHFSINSGKAPVVKYVLSLERAKELNIPNDESIIPTVMAIKSNQPEILTELFAGGCDPNPIIDDQPALMYAIKRNHDELCRVLIDGGAEYQEANSLGVEPIIYAINSRAYRCVKVLLSKGVKVAPYLHHKITDGLEVDELRQIILSGLNVDEQDSDGNTLLLLAIKANLDEIIDLLLEKKANPNIANNENEIPLSLAYLGKNEGLIKKLLYYRADPNVEIRSGECLVQIAATKQNFSIFGYLRNVNFDPNIKGAGGNTPLHFAVFSKIKKNKTDHRDLMVKKLLKVGADINAQNDIGFTAAHYATGLVKPETLEILVEDKNLNPFLVTKQKKTILHTAVESGRKNSVQTIASRFPKLLELKDKDGLTPLQIAVDGNKTECALALIKNGAKQGNTIYQLASNPDHEKLFEGLIPELNFQKPNEEGKTPLELGILANNYMFVRTLVNTANNLKRNINVKMSNGQMPVDFAEDRGFEDIAQLLNETLKTITEEGGAQSSDNDSEDSLT